DDRHPALTRAPAQLRELVGVAAQFLAVALPEGIEARGVVAEPAAQLRARSEVARPLVQAQVLALDAAGPHAVDQHAIAVPRLGRVVGALDADVDSHRGHVPVSGAGATRAIQ